MPNVRQKYTKCDTGDEIPALNTRAIKQRNVLKHFGLIPRINESMKQIDSSSN
jgi:hypothetical protein